MFKATEVDLDVQSVAGKSGKSGEDEDEESEDEEEAKKHGMDETGDTWDECLERFEYGKIYINFVKN